MGTRRENAGYLAGTVWFVLLLSACDGGDGGSGGAPAPLSSGTTVSGSVQAPNGAVAFREPRGIIEQVTALFIQPAHASLLGLSPVPDGTAIQLARFNSTGSGVTTLATSTTSGGRYSFNLTDRNLQFSNDLIVQVIGPTGKMIRAFVTNPTVDVNPASEVAVRLVLERIATTPGTALSHFTVKEVNDIAASVILLTNAKPFTGGTDLDATLATIRTAVLADTGLTAFVTAAAEAGQATRGPGDVGNYFPFAQGSVWNIQGTHAETGQPIITFQGLRKITGTTLIGSLTATVFSELTADGSGTPKESYLTKETTGITVRGNNDPTDPITPQVIPYQEMQFPLQVGASFHPITKSGLDFGRDLDGDGSNETATVTSEVTVIDFDTIVVSAGTFPNTAQIQLQMTFSVRLSKSGSAATSQQTQTIWLAPGIGPVKRQSVTHLRGFSQTTSEELVSYLISGQGAGGVPVTIATGVTEANSDLTNPGPSGMASNGTEYLVVFCSDLATPPGLYGAFHSNGVTGPPFFIAPRPCSANNGIGVAFDGRNYLVTFSNNGTIWGVRVSSSGSILDGSGGFPISTESATDTNWSPSVAFDGTNHLVAWGKFIEGAYDIYGARVTPAGQVLGEFPIFRASGEQIEPALAFDGTNYLVVWRDTRNGSGPTESTDVYGTRVSPAGRVLDPSGIAIATAPGAQGEPSIAFDGTNHFVVWSDVPQLGVSPPLIHIFGKRVQRDGTLLDGPANSQGLPINTMSVAKSAPTVTFDGTNYLVAWVVSDFSMTPPVGIYGAKISTSGQVIAGQPNGLGLLLYGPPQQDEATFGYPVACSNHANTLLTWINNSNVQGATKSIQGQLIFP